MGARTPQPVGKPHTFQNQGGTPHMKLYSDVHTGVGTPHMKLYSDVHNGVGTPHMKLHSDVHTGVGTPHKSRWGHRT